VLTDVFPPYGLVVRTPRLELRLPSPEQLAALGELAGAGVHDPALMPFTVAWTDQPPAERARSVLQHHWDVLSRFSPQRWTLAFAVLAGGEPVGFQDIGATDFAVLGEVSTGSWLGLRHQGRGIGTEMRAAVLELAFGGLGAALATSAAATDNPASLAVSRKLGYVPDGTERIAVRGAASEHVRLRLDRGAWEAHRTVPVRIEGLEPCRELLGAPVAAPPRILSHRFSIRSSITSANSGQVPMAGLGRARTGAFCPDAVSSGREVGGVAEPVTGAFRPVRGGNAFEETVERLLQAIKLGLVQAGDRLPPERELAGQLRVSRMTLREALADLQRAGYVESRRGRRGGTFVRYVPADGAVPAPDALERARGADLDDVLALRRVLEVGAVELAACRRLGPEEAARLVERRDECAAATGGGYRQRDSRLHLALAELSGAPSLAAAVADVRMRLNDLLDAIPLLPGNIRHSEEQHAAVVAAVLAGDPDRARAEMAGHVDGTAALLRGFLG
jgi:DNA-binding FadR family transcriptional regulator/RimJ/RimL family protein N-acetyltransferase